MYVEEFDLFLPLRGEDVCEWCAHRSNRDGRNQVVPLCEYHTFHMRLIPRNFRLVECVNTRKEGTVFSPDREKIGRLLQSKEMNGR